MIVGRQVTSSQGGACGGGEPQFNRGDPIYARDMNAMLRRLAALERSAAQTDERYKPHGRGLATAPVRAKVTTAGGAGSTFGAKLVDAAGNIPQGAVEQTVHVVAAYGSTGEISETPVLNNCVPKFTVGKYVWIEQLSGYGAGWWWHGTAIDASCT